ncbi:hypothetical protein MMC09_002352 [Bachmanniomyces sp. S44760]|nr:hypothetical protein [Bachmanniomyces sp. S44760]
MRFKTSIKDIQTFMKLTVSLSSLGKVAWVRLDNDQIRFTIIPEKGTQVWAVLAIETIFEEYTIQSAIANNTINLEVPIEPLQRALRSAQNATSASLRLTKKDNIPLLSLTIVTHAPLASSGRAFGNLSDEARGFRAGNNESALEEADGNDNGAMSFGSGIQRDSHTTITQDIPVRVISAASVEGIHEPRCPEPDVHILLPNLLQLKSISERFTKLGLSAIKRSSTTGGFARTGGVAAAVGAGAGPRLELSANMHGELRLGMRSDALNIESKWTGLSNPELDPGVIEGGEEGIRDHPSTRMKERQGEQGWATVRVEGRDWGRVLAVGRLGGRVVACKSGKQCLMTNTSKNRPTSLADRWCERNGILIIAGFCHGQALVLYVYLPSDDPSAEESVLTVSPLSIHAFCNKSYLVFFSKLKFAGKCP